MKKFLKMVTVTVLVLLLLAGGLLTVAVMTLDSGVKAAVEKGGSFALKVPVKLDEAHVSILKGRATLKGLTVRNPEGFNTAKAIGLGQASLEIRLASIGSDVIEIPELTVEAPELTVEGSVKGSNISRLLKNLDDTIARLDAGGEKQEQEDKGPEQKYRIGRILVTEAKLGLSATFMGGREASVTVPQIEIVPGDEPMTMAQLMKRVIGDVMREGAKNPGEVGNLLGGLVINSGLGTAGTAADLVKKGGQGVGNVVKKGAEGVGNVVKKGGEGVGTVLEKSGEGIKRLFGKDKPEEQPPEPEPPASQE